MQIFIKDIYRYPYDYSIDVEKNETIRNVKLKIAKRDDRYPDSFPLFYKGKELEDNRTLDDYNIQKESLLEVGFLFKLNFEGVIYKKTGLGCKCCGGHGDLFGFLSSKTGLPRDAFYLVNGSEKIHDKDFSVKKYSFAEYFFESDPKKTIRIRIKEEDKQFFAYRPEEINYDILEESIAKAYYCNYYYFPGFNDDKRLEKIKQRLFSKYSLDLIFNDDEDSEEIENLKEIILE